MLSTQISLIAIAAGVSVSASGFTELPTAANFQDAIDFEAQGREINYNSPN